MGPGTNYRSVGVQSLGVWGQGQTIELRFLLVVGGDFRLSMWFEAERQLHDLSNFGSHPSCTGIPKFSCAFWLPSLGLQVRCRPVAFCGIGLRIGMSWFFNGDSISYPQSPSLIIKTRGRYSMCVQLKLDVAACWHHPLLR